MQAGNSVRTIPTSSSGAKWAVLSRCQLRLAHTNVTFSATAELRGSLQKDVHDCSCQHDVEHGYREFVLELN